MASRGGASGGRVRSCSRQNDRGGPVRAVGSAIAGAVECRHRPVWSAAVTQVSVQQRLDELGWYHTVDVIDGATTKGWFDLRHALPGIPFPDVRGKRCLDIGTWDGFYAFELERRGAAEVVALDVPDLAGIDYPPEIREQAGTIDLSHRS